MHVHPRHYFLFLLHCVIYKMFTEFKKINCVFTKCSSCIFLKTIHLIIKHVCHVRICKRFIVHFANYFLHILEIYFLIHKPFLDFLFFYNSRRFFELVNLLQIHEHIKNSVTFFESMKKFKFWNIFTIHEQFLYQLFLKNMTIYRNYKHFFNTWTPFPNW